MIRTLLCNPFPPKPNPPMLLRMFFGGTSRHHFLATRILESLSKVLSKIFRAVRVIVSMAAFTLCLFKYIGPTWSVCNYGSPPSIKPFCLRAWSDPLYFSADFCIGLQGMLFFFCFRLPPSEEAGAHIFLSSSFCEMGFFLIPEESSFHRPWGMICFNALFPLAFQNCSLRC